MPMASERITVQLMEDSKVDFPELWLEVHIVGSNRFDHKSFGQMFSRARCRLAEKIEEADLVVFTGGADVDPSVYGQFPINGTHSNPERDAEELEIFQFCHDMGIPMVGVCRGAQLGWAACGGELYQDVDHHQGSHSMWAVDEAYEIKQVSSVHHQMIKAPTSIDPDKFRVLGTSAMSRVRRRGGKVEKPEQKDVAFRENGSHLDIEAFFLPERLFLGVQGHPEYAGYETYTRWFFKQIEHLILHNPDVAIKNNFHRVKQEVIDQRPPLQVPFPVPQDIITVEIS